MIAVLPAAGSASLRSTRSRVMESGAAPLPRWLERALAGRCGAYARSTGQPCRAWGLGRGGRCKNHGGMSTGPRTPEGRDRIREANRARARHPERQRVNQDNPHNATEVPA